MRLEIHHKIGKKVCRELQGLGYRINNKLFLFGNIFPDLIQSYLWCRHEYKYSREFIQKKLEMIKKRPKLFSFHLGILTHYICDYFCYPHSAGYDKGLIHHIIYEIRQKVPDKIYKPNLNIVEFTIEELDKLVEWYENIRKFFIDDESDCHIAVAVASNFLQAVC